FRRLQISVSPDGRFASAKLKPSVSSFTETSGTEKIVVFSLTGENVFNGNTLPYRLMTTGGSGNTTDGQYFYGDWMALTNSFLYYVKGNQEATSGNGAVVFQDHWIYRVAIVGSDNSPNPALLTPAVADANWSNTASTPLSLTFHRWAAPGCTNL